MSSMYCVIFVVILVIVIFFAINKWHKNMTLLRTVTNRHRGTGSERKLILKLLKHGIPAITVYHDLYVEQYCGHYSQIDAVVVTKVGIIVFEVKDYSGWIFGKGYQNYWTQVLAYGKEKHRFYNPILQNKGHIAALKKKLVGIADVPFYSVVVFYGKCKLKDISYIPDGTYVCYARSVTSIIGKIMRKNPPAKYKDKWGVINTLRDAVSNGENREIVKRHIQNVRKYRHLYSKGNLWLILDIRFRRFWRVLNLL